MKVVRWPGEAPKSVETRAGVGEPGQSVTQRQLCTFQNLYQLICNANLSYCNRVSLDLLGARSLSAVSNQKDLLVGTYVIRSSICAIQLVDL